MPNPESFISVSEAKSPFFVGVDLGGTNTKIGLVDDEGWTLAFESMPTKVPEGPERGVERMGKAVLAMIRQAGLTPEDIPAVGLGSPGTMDIPAGMLLEPHNLPGWFQFPIRARLERHCGKPVVFANDAGAAAFGEFWCGSGRHFESLVLLTLGTGLGGGIIVGDMSIEGRHSHGAECGHIIIDHHETARVCPCGAKGHLEGYVGATAVIQRTEEALASGRSSSLRKQLEGGAEMTPRLLAQEAEAGDDLALELIMETAGYLGVGIVTLVHTIDPDGVVLGGAMTFGGADHPLGERFLDRIRQEFRTRAFPVLAKNVAIDFALLGGDAGYIGAAGLARASCRRAGNV